MRRWGKAIAHVAPTSFLASPFKALIYPHLDGGLTGYTQTFLFALHLALMAGTILPNT
jgi:hypothetical protein